MTDKLVHSANIFPDVNELHRLIDATQLLPKLIRRQQEEEVLQLIDIEESWIDSAVTASLGSKTIDHVLFDRNITLSSYRLSLTLPEALRRFSEQQFGPGLEEAFLASRGSYDQVVYSALRVHDPDLLQELWIRLEEKECSFSELASTFGEGPEASRNGVIGPLAMGDIYPPQIGTLLRNLQPGEIHPPAQFGEWFLLLRLDHLSTARFDDNMRNFLLRQSLDSFFDNRVELIMKGVTPDQLYFDK